MTTFNATNVTLYIGEGQTPIQLSRVSYSPSDDAPAPVTSSAALTVSAKYEGSWGRDPLTMEAIRADIDAIFDSPGAFPDLLILSATGLATIKSILEEIEQKRRRFAAERTLVPRLRISRSGRPLYGLHPDYGPAFWTDRAGDALERRRVRSRATAFARASERRAKAVTQ